MDKIADDVYNHILTIENSNMRLFNLLVMCHAVWISDMDDNLRGIYDVKKYKTSDKFFVVQMSLPMNKVVTVQYPIKFWEKFKCKVGNNITQSDKITSIYELYDILEKHISLNI